MQCRSRLAATVAIMVIVLYASISFTWWWPSQLWFACKVYEILYTAQIFIHFTKKKKKHQNNFYWINIAFKTESIKIWWIQQNVFYLNNVSWNKSEIAEIYLKFSNPIINLLTCRKKQKFFSLIFWNKVKKWFGKDKYWGSCCYKKWGARKDVWSWNLYTKWWFYNLVVRSGCFLLNNDANSCYR